LKPLYLYNLFPKLYRDLDHWKEEIENINKMGFNSIYINPFHYPGFSGSLYAVKDYYKYNDQFFKNDTSHEKQLKSFLDLCKKKKIDVFMDLVVNHTAIDSILIDEHKNWYKMNEKGHVENPGAWEDGKWISWGDLATFDLDNSSDKTNLWKYLLEMCRHYLKMGFSGFRCDAAYQVSSEFWTFLISNIKKEFNDILFLAETLGCTPVQIQALSSCGFDYIFNSSKWWNFSDEWCLEQYELNRTIAPSISFPETHDTPRLMDEVKGNENQFLQRLYFAGLFSKGFMIATGFEYGFIERISSIQTTHEDWENTGQDYRSNIKNILDIKRSFKPFHEESPIEVVEQKNPLNVFCFVKEWDDQRVLTCLNKDVENDQKLIIANIEKILKESEIKDFSPGDKISGQIKELNIDLGPGEVKIFASAKHKSKK